MQNWYVLHSKPHKERQVMYELRHRSVEVYLPLIRVSPVNPRAAKVRAFFPCYLFAKFDPDNIGFNSVQWTPGLRRVLDFDGQPAVVQDSVVAEIKQRVSEITAAGGLKFDGLRPGDTVRIISGPFAGYEAIFDSRLAGTERARVLLEWIQHNQRRREHVHTIPVELSVSSIEKVRLKR